MNDDQAGEWTFPARCIEDALYGLVSAFVGDRFGLGGERGESE